MRIEPQLQYGRMKHYRSSIPKEARERVVATFVTGPQRYKVECRLNGKVVGIRRFYETGELEYERPLKDGLTHGIVYHSHFPGKLLSAEPYSNGLAHGVARQWSHDSKLIGTYTMKHGTGIDLWRCEHSEDGLPYLSEARYVKDGKWNGFEWWLHPDQKSVCEERHFREGQLHGIERSWNWDGRLCRGYPRYWVGGVRVAKRQYLKACVQDPNLPAFREMDNRPQRRFPVEVLGALS